MALAKTKLGESQESRRPEGYTLIEIMVALLIGSVLTAMAIPAGRSAISTYQLDGAVNSVSGSIQSTRYQAIMHGYPYQLDINGTSKMLQISSEPGGTTTFTASGSAVPISGSNVTVNVGTPNSSSLGHAILQFNANGSISIMSGQSSPLSLSISYNGTTKALTVSKYGSISVH